MKSVLRDIRLIPILLIATCCLVVLKVSGLLLEGGYILGDDMPKPKSWAQENLGFPSTGKMLDTSDITGSVPAKPAPSIGTSSEGVATASAIALSAAITKPHTSA